jgi:hydroxymethylglutaryl-CoA reductase (NADPH)
MQTVAATTTRHGKLTNVLCYQIGRQVLLNFGFTTGDAQGMNMIAKAADAVCQWLARQHPNSSYLLFSGLCSEKRASGFVMSRGKGKRVTAGALVPHEILRLYLHVSAGDLFRVWQSTVIGHLQAGALGYNAHYANGLTAIFIATGQDVANVVHAACGVTNFELHPEGLFVSVTLPALSVATVGGGTGLPTQREALEMMGCSGAGKAKKFAEVVAAALLGGEISMGAAIASGEFVAAHEHYGRNRPSRE